MNHLVFTTLLSFTALFAIAQQLNTIEQYCTVKIFHSVIGGATITIDGGKDDIMMHRLGKRLKDSSNILIRFKSPIDALNYMEKQGWKLVHTVSNGSDNNDFLYLFKRELKKE